MLILDAQNIVGRGTVLICEYDNSLKSGDIIFIDEISYKISGIETFSCFKKYMGVIIPTQENIKKFIGNNLTI